MDKFEVNKEIDLMSLEQFVECVKEGGFIDYDGYGYYSDGTYYYTDKVVYPSEIIDNKINHEYSHVAWFNR